MKSIKRRQFLRTGTVGLATLAAGARWRADLLAAPLGLDIGLALAGACTLRQECQKDLEGTLKKVAGIGYKQVETSAAGFSQGELCGPLESFGSRVAAGSNRKASDIRRILSANGLSCPSAHYSTSMMKSRWEKHIDDAKEVGLRYMICAGLEPSERKSLDDYRRMADFFNQVGEQCQKAGIQFGYHNHNFEFQTFDGVVAYDELLRRTDPQLVQLQLDCFWITLAGKDPVDYFKRYPGRFQLLHIKDLKPGYGPTTVPRQGPGPFTEVGRGRIDWARVFAAAPQGGLKHFYVEQDYCDQPSFESIKISYDYLRNLTV